VKQELIAIENKPGIISVNFEVLKKHLAKELEKYDVVVTSDTLKGAKELATELNATKKVIDTRRKDEVAKASEPIKAFDESMKELSTMCANGRQKLLDQIKVFEDETRATVSALLTKLRTELREKLGVEEEFYKAEFDDLILLSSITGTGNLTGAAKEKLKSRVSEEKSLQDRTLMRLLQLENQSYKAGLSSPLTRDHVRTFLFDSDEVYQGELDRIIASEIQRQEETEQALRKKIDKENEQKQPVVAPEPAPAEEPVQQATPAQAESRPVATGMPTATFSITCTFELEVDARASDSLVEQRLRDKLAAAGFTTLSSVQVKRQSKAA